MLDARPRGRRDLAPVDLRHKSIEAMEKHARRLNQQREVTMRDLIVVGFEGPDRAAEVLSQVLDLSTRAAGARTSSKSTTASR